MFGCEKPGRNVRAEAVVLDSADWPPAGANQRAGDLPRDRGRRVCAPPPTACSAAASPRWAVLQQANHIRHQHFDFDLV